MSALACGFASAGVAALYAIAHEIANGRRHGVMQVVWLFLAAAWFVAAALGRTA